MLKTDFKNLLEDLSLQTETNHKALCQFEVLTAIKAVVIFMVAPCYITQNSCIYITI